MLAYAAHSVVMLINIPKDMPRSTLARETRRLGEGAELMRRIDTEIRVPIFSLTSSRYGFQGGHRILGREITGDLLTIFSGGGLHSDLRRPDCRHLFLGGFWLDEDVFIAALAAQEEGFDTRVLVDLSIARDRLSQLSTMARLNQHGVLLTTTRQTIYEWALTAEEGAERETLIGLLRSGNSAGLGESLRNA
jgi:nicotinamidase-related amidase